MALLSVVNATSFYLLCFKPGRAYLIDLMKHGDWTRDHVLEVLINEWPNEDLIHEIKGVLGFNRTITEQDREVLRDKRCNVSFEYNGKIYNTSNLLLSAGTTYRARHSADNVYTAIEAIEGRHKAEPGWLPGMFAENGISWPTEPNFEFHIQECGCGILETRTETWIPLSGKFP